MTKTYKSDMNFILEGHDAFFFDDDKSNRKKGDWFIFWSQEGSELYQFYEDVGYGIKTMKWVDKKGGASTIVAHSKSSATIVASTMTMKGVTKVPYEMFNLPDIMKIGEPFCQVDDGFNTKTDYAMLLSFQSGFIMNPNMYTRKDIRDLQKAILDNLEKAKADPNFANEWIQRNKWVDEVDVEMIPTYNRKIYDDNDEPTGYKFGKIKEVRFNNGNTNKNI